MITSFRTRRFRECFEQLPPHVQAKCGEIFSVFAADPHSPILDRCKVVSGRLGEAERIHVGRDHRAFFRRGALRGDDDSVYVWEWIGDYGEARTFYTSGFKCSTAHPRRRTVTVVEQKKEPGKAVVPPKPEPITFEKLPDLLMEVATVAADEAGWRKRVGGELEQAKVALMQAQVYAKDVLTGQRTLQAQLDKLREELGTSRARVQQLEAAVAVAPSTKPAQVVVDGMVAEIAKLKTELRGVGKFCPHCGKDRISGLKPGEAA